VVDSSHCLHAVEDYINNKMYREDVSEAELYSKPGRVFNNVCDTINGIVDDATVGRVRSEIYQGLASL
jgi:hypothetical protein